MLTGNGAHQYNGGWISVACRGWSHHFFRTLTGGLQSFPIVDSPVWIKAFILKRSAPASWFVCP